MIFEGKGYNNAICEAVLYHHENYDGSGYPDNRKAEQIPLGARIMHVADAFIALISERPYREAFDFDSAIGIMIEDVKEFDMQVSLHSWMSYMRMGCLTGLSRASPQ